MEALVVGATGATGRLLVEQLLEKGVGVRAVVRTAGKLGEKVRSNPELKVIEASLLDLTDSEMVSLVEGCDALASCLGHNISFRGLYGKPRTLVTDAVRRLCSATASVTPKRPVRFALMNTTGVRNELLREHRSVGEKVVNGLLHALLPPHRDNVLAARYFRNEIGTDNPAVSWVIVRPDGLTDEELVTDYDLHPSPIRSPIFDAGKTSRINVAHFMAALLTDQNTWDEWKGQSPVIYNTQAT